MRERKQNHASYTNNNNNNNMKYAIATIVAIAPATPTTTTIIGNTFYKHKQTKREARTGIPNECRAARNGIKT